MARPRDILTSGRGVRPRAGSWEVTVTGEMADVVFAELTVYTDALVMRGRARLPRRPLADGLDAMPGGILVLYDATVDEPGARGRPVSAALAHIRTDAILFVLADGVVGESGSASNPSLLIAVPPFSVAGRVSVTSGAADLGEALRQVPRTGFVTVTGATYWSESLGEGRRRSPSATLNAAKIQLIMPYRDVDPWAGLDQPRASDGGMGLDANRGFDQGMTPGDEA